MAYRMAFVMEQTLGQITHTQNLQNWVANDPEIEPIWIPIAYDSPAGWGAVPVVKTNWTLRASLEARSRVRAVLQTQNVDCLFFHTLVTALFAHRLMRQ